MTTAQSARQKKRFLAHFREYGNISAACRAVDLERRRVYDWQEQDDQFAAAYREAEIESTEVLEVEARRRAVEGTKRLKFDRGVAVLDPETQQPYVENEYSDTLLIFLLKARAPDKYRERVDLTHGGRIGVDDASGLSDAARADRIARLLERAGARPAGPADAGPPDLGAAARPADGGVAL